ncbi:MAG: class I SAM-dependent methyltransferase [Hamadaea sp.]|uniref:class I SAM-dependent methyltransferase n=1 Tax=Hamadaea sp. TaxID=2024425 RepID=UPI0017920168|nr:class I SAM-dependent methyltransferase [Hamadaea sp.]NUR47749.1 class I SAM-dependent methyltransferase [Hamadaea sp.]NUR72285.1 class I SAM-dependent methyltransferase [Hamadaea sp.]NUT23241.1 class I SAM-dependent methyltransferase [Hamadaea sp.]
MTQADSPSTLGTTIDYDANGYDYQQYWQGRDYELWAEDRALRRLVPRLGAYRWFVDLGGAFGRNSGYYLPNADRAVILDYSATNLTNAARRHPEAVASGRLGLVRCDLNAIPFADLAFDSGMVIRVLHHLSDVDGALAEMGRIVRSSWLVDVPIKHHLLGLVRGAATGRLRQIRSAEPLITGASDEKYFNFQLDAVRDRLTGIGFQTRLGASANNFRRWESRVPDQVARYARPLVQGMEAATQGLGKGWLGPSQLVLATRVPAVDSPYAPSADESFTDRMACPSCRGALAFSADSATCSPCSRSYPKSGPFWDFV